MNTEIKKLKELGAPDWYLAFLEAGLPSCRMNASDAVGPMVLAWGYSQATNKRLVNLVKKQESDYEALKDRWNKQVTHGRKLAGCLNEKNLWNTRLQDANKQLRTQNPLSDKEYIGALKGVPLFTHKDVAKTAIVTLGEIAHERADLERSKRDLESTRSALADLESKLYNTKLDLECTQRALKAQTNLTAVAKQDVVLLRQSPKWDELRAERDRALQERDAGLLNENKLTAQHDKVLGQYQVCKKELEQTVKAKDAAVEQAKDWKKKYQDRKNLDFGLFYGANPFKASTCHDEVTFSVPDAKPCKEKFAELYPAVWEMFKRPLQEHQEQFEAQYPEFYKNVDSGRTQCKEPNQANAPKSPTAMLQDGVATHDDGKKSRFRCNGSLYVVTEDENTKYYWTYEPLVGGVVKLTRKLPETPQAPQVFQDKRVDTGRMSSQKPDVQHIPLGHPSLRRADENTDMVDALKWAIDFGRAEQAVLGIRVTQPLTLKVPRVDTGVWLWHDKQHPSRIYQIRTMSLTGKVTKAVSSLGTMQYTWRVAECADGYILTLESTCTLKS